MAKKIVRKKYTKEEKAAVVSDVLVNGLTLQVAAEKASISNIGMVRRWVKEHNERPGELLTSNASDTTKPSKSSKPIKSIQPTMATSGDLGDALREHIEVIDLEIERLQQSRATFEQALELI